MKIYTKTGDQGYTSLIGGERVPKYHLRIESYGSIDELNAYIGLIADGELQKEDVNILKKIQQQLFVLGSHLAVSDKQYLSTLPSISTDAIKLLELEIDTTEQTLSPLKNFILPGGHLSASYCQIARCVCRRAERLVVHLSSEEFVENNIIIYLNRLSDYLFILARKICHQNKITETIWSTQ